MAATNDVADRVRKVIADHLGVEAETVVDTADFNNDLGADSLDAVELVMACEEEFSIEMPDDDLETLTTVGDLIKYVRGRIG